ncbi:hypothetical protein BDSB_11575 [Burkholderia dolosa PC543]|nr:hypothetical protein BDSB_11575 [Burkholderia dolosa PC543]
MLGNQDGFEAAVAVARHLDANRAVFGQDRLGSFAVALIRGVGRLGCTGRVAEMMVHLAAQRRSISAF